MVLEEPVMQAADLEKDCNSFTVCVAIGMFVLPGVWGTILPSFVFRTGLFGIECCILKVLQRPTGKFGPF